MPDQQKMLQPPEFFVVELHAKPIGYQYRLANSIYLEGVGQPHAYFILSFLPNRHGHCCASALKQIKFEL